MSVSSLELIDPIKLVKFTIAAMNPSKKKTKSKPKAPKPPKPPKPY